MGGRVKCVLSFFSGKTGGPLPLGLDRGSVSGGEAGGESRRAPGSTFLRFSNQLGEETPY